MRSVFFALLFSAALSAQTTNMIPAPPDVAAPPKDATKTASGLATRVLTRGTGTEHPAADEIVTVNYTGWTTDGKMFDSSVTRGAAATFPLNRVINGWTEGLQLMVIGEKRRLWIPEALAYKGQRDPKGMLVFDVELISMPVRAPLDVKAPPAEAKKTASGLAYPRGRQGQVHQRLTRHGPLHGWTTDGKRFDSSITTGQPISFR